MSQNSIEKIVERCVVLEPVRPERPATPRQEFHHSHHRMSRKGRAIIEAQENGR